MPKASQQHNQSSFGYDLLSRSDGDERRITGMRAMPSSSGAHFSAADDPCHALRQRSIIDSMPPQMRLLRAMIGRLVIVR